jgi:hypothetical protein
VLAENPLSVLTFIVAPAILTNASSVMALGTSNRFARAIDRIRTLASQVEGKDPRQSPEVELKVRQLRVAQQRGLYLVRALTAFYTAVGAFAAAALLSLLSAGLVMGTVPFAGNFALGLALAAGTAGVAGLVTGASLLVRETRMTLRILMEETEFMLERTAARAAGSEAIVGTISADNFPTPPV